MEAYVAEAKTYASQQWGVGYFDKSNEIVWDQTACTIAFPNNSAFTAPNGKHIALTAQTITYDNSVVAYMLTINMSTGVISLQDFLKTFADTDLISIGLLYRCKLTIFGAEGIIIIKNPIKYPYVSYPSGMQTQFTDDIKIGIVGTADDYLINSKLWFWVDWNNHEIFFPQGFISFGWQSNALKTQTVTISADDDGTYNIAYKLYCDALNQTVYACEWDTINKNNNDLLIGYIWGTHLYLFGVSQDQIFVKDSTREVYFFGDSITAGVGTTYPYFTHMLNICQPKNYGIGSIGYVQTTTDNVCVGQGDENSGTYQTESGNNTVLDVMKAHSDFTRCSIAAGTNDWSASINIDTFRTAVENTLDYALSITPKVSVLLPVRRTGDTNKNSAGYTLKDYSEIIKTACEERSIVYTDGWNVGLNPNNALNKSTFFSDTVHPNNAGHYRMYIAYKETIRSLII